MSSPKEIIGKVTSQRLWRNNLWLSIPTANPKKSLYFSDQLTDEEQEFAAGLADSTSGIDTKDGNQRDRWYQYGDLQELDFCFEAVKIPVSRFSNGSYPVWYASSDQDGSVAEVTYHCRRQAARELEHTQHENILRFERAFCKARVQFTGYDFRELAASRSEPGLLENGPPYPYCNELGATLQSSSQGLISLSRRLGKAELWAVFQRDAILESRVKAFWHVEIAKSGETRVCGCLVEYDDGWYQELEG